MPQIQTISMRGNTWPVWRYRAERMADDGITRLVQCQDRHYEDVRRDSRALEARFPHDSAIDRSNHGLPIPW